ncbi:MAG: NAAT family transporter, partial [Thauera sp.]|nr:NAAT family transporter [Thauera sp.]
MEFAKIFITLAALINPFGAIPAFIGLTQGQSSLERRRTARTAALATVLVITVTALAGQYILAGFGITVPSLQVGGGVLLFIVAISMFNAQPAPSRTTPEETDEAAERANIAVVPLTIPLLTGPGT